MACVHALKGKRKEALAGLERAFTLTPTLVAHAKQDSDLTSLWETPEFKALVAREYAPPAPRDVGENTVRVN